MVTLFRSRLLNVLDYILMGSTEKEGTVVETQDMTESLKGTFPHEVNGNHHYSNDCVVNN